MTIRLTEDDDPDGYVTVDFDYEGCEEIENDLAGKMTDDELPPALRLGAEMVALSRSKGDEDECSFRILDQGD